LSTPDDYNPFNPLARDNLAASAGEALLEQDPVPLGAVGTPLGAGVYAIYYVGDYPAYSGIKEANAGGLWNAPIYVGKAVPKGARKGGQSASGKPGKELAKRLKEHADSIEAAGNLKLDDFWCRYLIVDDIWIPLGENLMISHFTPLWNTTVDGFGNHTPGAGRFNQKRSRWDVIHAGREWAAKCQPRPESASDINKEIVEHLRSRPKLTGAKRLYRT